MAGTDKILLEITPQVLLKAYACGIFPMADSASDPGLFWIEPDVRGIIPLDSLHISKSLKKSIRQNRFTIKVDTDFAGVISSCAEKTELRNNTWINGRIRHLYQELFEMGHCHSVEAWQGNQLVGGLYGVSLGSAFFGESMFSRETDASKVALVYLVHRLIHGGYTLLDTQFTTPHLLSMGAKELPRAEYDEVLAAAISKTADFYPESYDPDQPCDQPCGAGTSESILQFFNQTS